MKNLFNRRLIGFLILFTFLSLPLFSQNRGVSQLPANAKRYALVIGVNEYDDSQITPLSGAGNDAKTLADSLVMHAGFPKENVILLTPDQPGERRPTRGNILRRLSNLAGVLPKDGVFLFAFAGHGIERDGRAFLLPTDSQVSNDVKLLQQTAIEVNTIKDNIRATGVGQVLMILDACRDDPSAGRGVTRDNPMTPALTKALNLKKEVTAFATIYATELGKRAYELKEKNQGYFTYALVEGLKGEAANSKGEVTLATLVKYLKEKVPQKVALDLGKGKEQKPFAVIEGYNPEALVLATKGVLTGESMFEKTAASKKSETALDNLSGTVWVGNTPETGEFTWEFLPDGKLKQSFEGIKNGAKTIMTANGTWKQAGKSIQVSFSYSTMSGKIEDGVLKLKGTNVEGVEFTRTLFPKIQ